MRRTHTIHDENVDLIVEAIRLSIAKLSLVVAVTGTAIVIAILTR